MRKFFYGWLTGIVSLCLAGAALTPTALDLVLNNTEVYSLELGDGMFYLRLRPILFSDPLCRRIDVSRYKEGPRFGWTSAATFIDMTYQYHFLKGNITGGSPAIAARCAEGWDTAPPALASDGASIVLGGSMTTAEGTWTFGAATAAGGNALMKNGVQAAGGFGTKLLYVGGGIYTFTLQSAWYHWATDHWVNVDASIIPAAPVAVPPLPALPAPAYKVSTNGTALTRPIYDAAMKQIGTVAVGTKCEDAVIRKTTVEYHYTTNASNLRGLAACASSLRF